MNIISTSQTTRCNNTFVIEMSDLGPNFNLEPVYPDACDRGVKLISHKTGREAVFYLSSEDRTRDNEVSGFYFSPIPETVRMLPELKNFKILIIND